MSHPSQPASLSSQVDQLNFKYAVRRVTGLDVDAGHVFNIVKDGEVIAPAVTLSQLQSRPNLLSLLFITGVSLEGVGCDIGPWRGGASNSVARALSCLEPGEMVVVHCPTQPSSPASKYRADHGAFINISCRIGTVHKRDFSVLKRQLQGAVGGDADMVSQISKAFSALRSAPEPATVQEKPLEKVDRGQPQPSYQVAITLFKNRVSEGDNLFSWSTRKASDDDEALRFTLPAIFDFNPSPSLTEPAFYDRLYNAPAHLITNSDGRPYLRRSDGSLFKIPKTAGPKRKTGV